MEHITSFLMVIVMAGILLIHLITELKQRKTNPKTPERLSECCNARIIHCGGAKKNIQRKTFTCKKCGKDARISMSKVLPPTPVNIRPNTSSSISKFKH